MLSDQFFFQPGPVLAANRWIGHADQKEMFFCEHEFSTGYPECYFLFPNRFAKRIGFDTCLFEKFAPCRFDKAFTVMHRPARRRPKRPSFQRSCLCSNRNNKTSLVELIINSRAEGRRRMVRASLLNRPLADLHMLSTGAAKVLFGGEPRCRLYRPAAGTDNHDQRALRSQFLRGRLVTLVHADH